MRTRLTQQAASRSLDTTQIHELPHLSKHSLLIKLREERGGGDTVRRGG